MFIYKKLLSNPTVDSNFWRRAVEVYSILHVLGALYYFLKDNTSKGCTMGSKPFKSRMYKNSKNIHSNFLFYLCITMYNWPVSKISHQTIRIWIWLQNRFDPSVGILLARLMPLKGRNCKYCKLLEHFQWLPLDSF